MLFVDHVCYFNTICVWTVSV